MRKGEYFCTKCQQVVLPELGVFHHPHRGDEIGLVCPFDDHVVVYRELKPEMA